MRGRGADTPFSIRPSILRSAAGSRNPADACFSPASTPASPGKATWRARLRAAVAPLQKSPPLTAWAPRRVFSPSSLAHDPCLVQLHLMHTNPTDAELKQLMANASTIAVVGASSNPEKA